ncbi:helix-turn-helix domain-containing protein [Actinomadura adrarensis]|uniref:Helix-turn-helix domain-containing protein n=1 Tax=Actinomadura adrarensis TaxID=1819600 RepID=A0ABW3CAA9_9ACTN
MNHNSPAGRSGDDEWLTSGEAAETLSVSRRTVARWAKSGRLKSIRTLGGHHRFRRADIEAAVRAKGAGQ